MYITRRYIEKPKAMKEMITTTILAIRKMDDGLNNVTEIMNPIHRETKNRIISIRSNCHFTHKPGFGGSDSVFFLPPSSSS